MAPAPPFGAVEQQCLEYFSLVGAAPLSRWVFATLLVRADKSGIVRDRIATLARWSGASERVVSRSLAELARLGCVHRSKHHDPRREPGHAWQWTTTVRAHPTWSPEPLEQLIAATIALIAVRFPLLEEVAPDARSSRKRSHGMTEEVAQNDGRGRTDVTDNPDRPIQTFYPDDDGRRHDGAETGDAGEDGTRGLDGPRGDGGATFDGGRGPRPDGSPSEIGVPRVVQDGADAILDADGLWGDLSDADGSDQQAAVTALLFDAHARGVAVGLEVERWLAFQTTHGRPRAPIAALRAWLAIARAGEAGAAAPAPRVTCGEAGCSAAGYGTPSLCVAHHFALRSAPH